MSNISLEIIGNFTPGQQLIKALAVDPQQTAITFGNCRALPWLLVRNWHQGRTTFDELFLSALIRQRYITMQKINMLGIVLTLGKNSLPGTDDINLGVIQQSEQMAFTHIFERNQSSGEIQIKIAIRPYIIFLCVHNFLIIYF